MTFTMEITEEQARVIHKEITSPGMMGKGVQPITVEQYLIKVIKGTIGRLAELQNASTK